MRRSVGTFRSPRCFCHKRGCRRKEDAQTRGAGREDTGDKGTSRELQQSPRGQMLVLWKDQESRQAANEKGPGGERQNSSIREFCERFDPDIAGNVENKWAGSWGSTRRGREQVVRRTQPTWPLKCPPPPTVKEEVRPPQTLLESRKREEFPNS